MIPSEFVISSQDHEELEFGIEEKRKRIECLLLLENGKKSLDDAILKDVALNMHLVY
jgi:hypothetical protein